MNIYIKSVSLFLISFLGGAFAAQPKASTPSVSNLQEALFNVRKVILNFPVNDSSAAQVYEKQYNPVLTACAKVLYDNAQQQILQTLQEIDNRIAYWRYQKDHEWNYFLTKNPIKWFKGEQQKVEIAHNLEQLQSHQGELYVLLGRLAELGGEYDRNFKTVFKTDYTKAYAWIDKLLELLSRVKITFTPTSSMSSFIIRAHLLKLKLAHIRNFKNDVLSEIKETQLPAHIERNWLKYSALMVGAVLGYKYITFEQLKNSYDSVKENVFDPIMAPVKRSVYVLFPELREKPQHAKVILPSLATTHETSLGLAKQFVTDTNKKYEIGNATEIINSMDKGDYTEFQKFLGAVAKKEKIDTSKVSILNPTATAQMIAEWLANQSDYAHGLIYLFQLLGLGATGEVQKFILDAVEAQKRDFKGVRDLLLLTPTAFVAGLGYFGYKKLTARDYSSIRRALIEINSLFVDQKKPLDDERYGKMLYLVYNLKQRAQRSVPVADRADFIDDLERIELQEFDVAAKRHIVDDMFRKYSFLQ